MSEERRQAERSRLASLLYYGGRVVRQGSGIQIEPRSLAYYGSMLVLVGLGCWLYLHQATQSSLTGAEIVRLIKSRQRLALEIAELETEVALAGGTERHLSQIDETRYVWSWAVAAERRISYVPAEREGSDLAAEPATPQDTERQPATTSFGGIWRELVGQMDAWLGQPIPH